MRDDEQKMVCGLLFSQIGYDLSGYKRLIIRGPAGWLDDRARLEVFRDDRRILDGVMSEWGSCWGSHWWVGDFSAVGVPGLHRVRVSDGRVVMESEPFVIEDDCLFRRTWQSVALGQAERRQRFAIGQRGWFDAGMQWQEANSHAAYLLGLCDLRELRENQLSPEDLRRLDRQLLNGAHHLGDLQDLARSRGLAAGAVVHQCFKYDEVVLTADASKAAAAWARVAWVLETTHPAEAGAFRRRAREALCWLEDPRPVPEPVFNAVAYGLPPGALAPEGMTTTDLLMMLEAEVALSDGAPSAAVRRLARELGGRQVRRGEMADGWHGMFRQFRGSDITVKAWTHGMLAQKDSIPGDLGNTLGLHLFPLVRLLDSYPEDADAPLWLGMLEDFATGYFLPACRRNPFLLCPNGHFQDQGPLWFAGLWHGCNAVYGLAAALAKDLGRLLGDPVFASIAQGNLQWIAGLNAGITRGALRSCFVHEADLAEDEARPVSLIHGIGAHTAGSWLNIRGSICNGFAVGEQFQWDVPPVQPEDGPFRLTDEDWITHAGGWLAGIARRG